MDSHEVNCQSNKNSEQQCLVLSTIAKMNFSKHNRLFYLTKTLLSDINIAALKCCIILKML